jgi:tetratricopeptide (TPR) repeat protein
MDAKRDNQYGAAAAPDRGRVLVAAPSDYAEMSTAIMRILQRDRNAVNTVEISNKQLPIDFGDEALVLIWGDDPSLDLASRQLGDRALARQALATIIAADDVVARLPDRFQARVLSSEASLEHVAKFAADTVELGIIRASSSPETTARARAVALENQAQNLSALGLFEEGIAQRRLAVFHRRWLLEAAITSADRYAAQKRLAASLIDLAECCTQIDRFEEAIGGAGEAAELLDPLGREPCREQAKKHQTSLVSLRARALALLSMALMEQGDWGAAVGALEDAVAIYRKLSSGKYPSARPRLGALLSHLAHAHLGAGQNAGAEKAGLESVVHFRAAARTGDPADLENLAAALLRMAAVHLARGEKKLAEAATSEAVDILRETEASADEVAAALIWHGRALAQLGRRDEALGAFAETIATARDCSAGDPDSFRPILAEALADAADLLMTTGESAEAVKLAEEALEALGSGALADDLTFDSRHAINAAMAAAPNEIASHAPRADALLSPLRQRLVAITDTRTRPGFRSAAMQWVRQSVASAKRIWRGH